MINIVNNEPLTALNYTQHLERGYCANHPDVVAGTKAQVVDRAVKQLFTLLQGLKCEIGEDDDGIIFNLGYTPTGGPSGLIRVKKADSKLQYYDITAAAWKDIGSGGIADHTLLSNIGITSHAAIDTHINDATKHWPTPQQYTPSDLDTHLADLRKHNMPGGIDITSNLTLTADHVLRPMLLVVSNACEITLPTGPDGMRATIYVRNPIQATIYFDVEWTGGGIMLPGVSSPSTRIRNTSATRGDCVVLRSMTMLDVWVVESYIGTWTAV